MDTTGFLKMDSIWSGFNLNSLPVDASSAQAVTSTRVNFTCVWSFLRLMFSSCNQPIGSLLAQTCSKDMFFKFLFSMMSLTSSCTRKLVQRNAADSLQRTRSSYMNVSTGWDALICGLNCAWIQSNLKTSKQINKISSKNSRRNTPPGTLRRMRHGPSTCPPLSPTRATLQGAAALAAPDAARSGAAAEAVAGAGRAASPPMDSLKHGETWRTTLSWLFNIAMEDHHF